jgi:hypothetical protein
MVNTELGRRWFQFSLRGLLAALTITAIALGAWDGSAAFQIWKLNTGHPGLTWVPTAHSFFKLRSADRGLLPTPGDERPKAVA